MDVFKERNEKKNRNTTEIMVQPQTKLVEKDAYCREILMENQELYTYLKRNYTKTAYRFEKIFGKLFSYKRFSKKELDEIVSLKLDSISSTAGIDKLSNLESVHIKNVSDVRDIEKVEKLKNFELDVSNHGIDPNKLAVISHKEGLEKMYIHGKSVKNISSDHALDFSDKARISYGIVGELTSEQFSKVQLRIEEIKKLIKPGMSEVQKVELIYKNMLTDKFEYDYNSLSERSNSFLINKTMYGPLVEKKGVCAGVADALEATLENVGIEAHSCGGWIGKEPAAGNAHQWNQVKVDGQWYNLDLTNDYDKDEWEYFMKSDKDFVWSENHCADKEDIFEKVHECNSTKYDVVYGKGYIKRQKNLLEEKNVELNKSGEDKILRSKEDFDSGR